MELRDKDTMGLESMSMNMSMSMSMRTEGLIKTAEVEQLVRRVVPDEVGECVISACCFVFCLWATSLINN